ncbi:hypothetical protein GCM10009092_29410 [Bowmanella denitrificans]|uniref:Uncharacterized protein n=1 Tax=Bowmanella denitrificans TaxID=366582 RepID=A0ABN0XGJ8_9ALTE
MSAFMSLALLITALSSIYLFQEFRLEQNNNIHSDQPLIVLNYLGSALPAAGLGLLVLSIAFANQVYLRLTNKHDPKKPDKLTSYCGYALLICLMGLLISRSYLNNLWDNQAKQQGYNPCPSMTLLKSSLTRTAWVRDENLCSLDLAVISDQQIQPLLLCSCLSTTAVRWTNRDIPLRIGRRLPPDRLTLNLSVDCRQVCEVKSNYQI